MSTTTLNNFDDASVMHVINMITYFGKYFKKPSKNITFVSVQLGQLIAFKGMLIGIYKSPDLFNRKHFGLVFSKNFTHSQIQQKIEDRDPMETDDSRRSFHNAITY